MGYSIHIKGSVAMLETIIGAIIGGFLAIAGGWFAMWYQLRKTMKNRMSEVIAEQKVTANSEAYSHCKKVQSKLAQNRLDDTLKFIASHEEWFFSKRLFLPGQFPAKWLSVRNKLISWQSDKNKTSKKKEALREQTRRTADEAIDEIYKDVDLERIEVN